jgi:hypothetical protein
MEATKEVVMELSKEAKRSFLKVRIAIVAALFAAMAVASVAQRPHHDAQPRQVALQE